MSDAPPQNAEAEESLLGAMLVSNAALQVVLTDVGVKPEHFYFDKHRAIFSAIRAVAGVNGTADPLMVAARLPEHKHYVSDLAARVPVAGNARHYGEIIIELAGLRARLLGAYEVIEGVKERDDEKIQAGVLAVSQDVEADSEPSTPEEIGAEMYDWLERGPEDGEALTLPWRELHPFCAGGYRRGQMSIVTGWSGMGKSLVLLQMFKHWAKQGHRNLLLTTEMDRRELVARYLASESGVAYEKLILRRLTAEDWKLINKPLQNIPFHHYDAEGWSAERIVSAIVTKRPDIAAIDPWNLIPHRDYFHMGETARRLKEIARKANCHLVVVAHLKTARHKDGKKPRPTQADIRDSGMLFNNAHRVLVLHREQNDKAKSQRKGELYFMKSRDAPEGGIDVEFRPRYLRFDPEGTEEAEEKAREPELFP